MTSCCICICICICCQRQRLKAFSADCRIDHPHRLGFAPRPAKFSVTIVPSPFLSTHNHSWEVGQLGVGYCLTAIKIIVDLDISYPQHHRRFGCTLIHSATPSSGYYENPMLSEEWLQCLEEMFWREGPWENCGEAATWNKHSTRSFLLWP